MSNAYKRGKSNYALLHIGMSTDIGAVRYGTGRQQTGAKEIIATVIAVISGIPIRPRITNKL
jgi:hypothetical protein